MSFEAMVVKPRWRLKNVADGSGKLNCGCVTVSSQSERLLEHDIRFCQARLHSVCFTHPSTICTSKPNPNLTAAHRTQTLTIKRTDRDKRLFQSSATSRRRPPYYASQLSATRTHYSHPGKPSSATVAIHSNGELQLQTQ